MVQIWAKIRRIPLRDLPRRSFLFLHRKWSYFKQKQLFKDGRYAVGEQELGRVIKKKSVDEVVQGIGCWKLGITAVDAHTKKQTVRHLHEQHPEMVARIMASANNICDHRFDVLGSDNHDYGDDIDWSLDVKSGFRWDPTFHLDLKLEDGSNEADVKVPWELNRCHQFVCLGQAYWLSGEERYAQAFKRQLNSWLSSNPVRGSVNWSNAMEVAIRIVNWFWACAFFRDAPSFTDRDRQRFLLSALEHGRFIMDHLEKWPGEPANNHYIADLAGLVYLGVLLPDLSESEKWLQVGLDGLLAEMELQILPDGVDYESSISYHRLVTECYASAFALCKQNQVNIPTSAWKKLSQMIEFVVYYTHPDGGSPLVGDADDGRLHVLSPGRSNDHRHLLAMGGFLYQCTDWQKRAASLWSEAIWWGGEPLNWSDDAPICPPKSKGFTNSGFYVMRHQDAFLMTHCGHDAKVRGHTHNDLLGFELAVGQQIWVVDPGTYVYSTSAIWRNHFRATAAHNTLRIDKAEINRFEASEIFKLNRDAVAIVHDWQSTDSYDLLDAQHSGYLRLPGRLLHRRRIYFNKSDVYWQIEDSVTGDGEHTVEGYLHFAPGLDIITQNDTSFMVKGAQDSGLYVSVQADQNFQICFDEDWVSRAYGHKNKAIVAHLEVQTTLPLVWTWLLMPVSDWRNVPDLPDQSLPF